MFDIQTETIEWAGRTLTLETGRMARQANGAVVATYGETTVLATAVAQKDVKPGTDFFPLTVNYQEKYYAAGKIPGGYFKREGRPTDKETLISRLIDRPIRPLFPKGFKNDTQVIITVLSHDILDHGIEGAAGLASWIEKLDNRDRCRSGAKDWGIGPDQHIVHFGRDRDCLCHGLGAGGIPGRAAKTCGANSQNG